MLEIERKYTLKSSIQDKIDQLPAGIAIKQGYLSKAVERTVRVRVKGDKGYLTIKGKTVGIPLAEAIALLELCEPHIIEKTRYTFLENNLEWELDVFEGNNTGLLIVEVELPSEDHPIVLPKWVDMEVSDDPRYYNSYLSEHPFRNWDSE